MALADLVPNLPGTAGGLQTISLAFGAASLAEGVLRPPFRTQFAPLVGGDFDVITLDATLSEVHSAEVELTEHPIEQGANITDHARPKPREIEIDGFITNDPVDLSLPLAALRAVPALGMAIPTAAGITQQITNALAGSDIVRDAFNKLQRLYQNSALVKVITPYGSYVNMMLKSLRVTRDPTVGNGLRFKVTFREVFLVTSQLVQVTLPPSAQSQLDTGAQSPIPAPTKVTKNAISQLASVTGLGQAVRARQ